MFFFSNFGGFVNNNKFLRKKNIYLHSIFYLVICAKERFIIYVNSLQRKNLDGCMFSSCHVQFSE